MEEKNWGKVLAWVVLIALVLVGIFWAVFFAPALANNQLIIPIRRDFYEKVLEKIYLPEQLPYSVMVKEALIRHERQMYGYILIGRLVEMDYGQEKLTLQDKSGRVWRAALPLISISPNQWDNWRVFYVNQYTTCRACGCVPVSPPSTSVAPGGQSAPPPIPTNTRYM